MLSFRIPPLSSRWGSDVNGAKVCMRDALSLLHLVVQLSTIPWLANELVRERIGVHPCDKRRPISIAKSEYPAVSPVVMASDSDATQGYR